MATETIGGFEFVAKNGKNADKSDDKETHVFDERVAEYERLWLVRGGMRYAGSALGASDATKKDADNSPLARHYLKFKKDEKRLRKAVGKLDGDFPTYAAQFEKPDLVEVRDVTAEIEEISGADLRYPVFVPANYELPPEWDTDETTETTETTEADDQEICGAETKSGKPCKWSPADSCPHHGDTDETGDDSGSDLASIDGDKLEIVNRMLDNGFTKDEIISLLA